MAIIKGYFEEFHFPECKIENFEFIGDNLIVNIKSELAVYPPHPLADKHKFLDPCKVEFKNIKYSRQTFDEYDEEAREYNKEEQEFITEFSPGVTSNIEYEGYSIEGFLLNPKKGWVTFDIIAEEFYFDDLKD
jgi:hypothetical protein